MNPIPQLDALATPKSKFTLLVTGGGMMGVDVRKVIVSKGWLNCAGGDLLCYSEPRGRKIFNLMPILQRGVIVLKGDETSRPVFESHAPAVGGVHSFMMDGTGGRFLDYNNEGADALIAYLKKHLVLHTLGPKNTLKLLGEKREEHGERQISDPDFKRKLLEGLGLAVELEPAAPKAPERKSLLTPAMKEKLKAADGVEITTPLFKIFNPEGSQTWLLCSLEDDEDTLWAVCDLGFGCVEYGSVSLRELEETRGSRFKMPLERDIHFDGKGLFLSDLLSKESLTA